MKFSERIGARRARQAGSNEPTPSLRTALWNLVHESLFPLGRRLRAGAAEPPGIRMDEYGRACRSIGGDQHLIGDPVKS